MTDFLYIRWRQDGSDDNRTNPQPGDTTWLSGSLKLINPSDPTQDEGLALTGVDQQIRVLVDTTQTTTNVGVQVWACAYGTAGTPYIPSANGTAGLEREFDDQLNPFTANPAPPAPQLQVDLDWRPLTQDLEDIGVPTDADLHVCLLANCYSTAGQGDGAKIPPPGPPVLNVATNRHHAQRNIRIHPVPTSGLMASVQMFAGNPFAEGEEVFEFDVLEVRKPFLHKQTLQQLQDGRWLRAESKYGGRGGKLQLARKPVRELGMRLAGEQGVKGLKVPLTAGKPQHLEVDVAIPEAPPGTLHVLDVVHRGRRKKLPVGGARILLLTVDDERFRALATPQQLSTA